MVAITVMVVMEVQVVVVLLLLQVIQAAQQLLGKAMQEAIIQVLLRIQEEAVEAQEQSVLLL
jgi:hypothetical protein